MASNAPKYWKRTGWVAIEGNDHRMHRYGGTEDSLDFKFTGEKTGSIYTQFTVGILGLGRDTINDLTVWNLAESFKRKRRIQVYAGYANDRMSNPIFDGFVVDAIPTNPPEMWLNFNCMRFFGKDEPITDVDPMVEKPLGEIAQKIASILDLGWNGKSWRSVEVSSTKKASFHFKYTKAQLLREFEKKFGVRAFDRDGILVIDDKRPWITHASEGPSWTLSTETGLLNLSNIKMVGLSAKCRLNDSAGLLDWVAMDSKIVPKANNDTYLVLKKKHTGHFRGEEWFTEYDCIRRFAKV